MGHIHLGVLPNSRKWKEVVALLTDGAAREDVVAASAAAAERELLAAVRDPVFVEAVRLLATVPAAARSEDFGQALRDADIPIQGTPDLLGLVTAVGQRLDEVARNRASPSDIGEISRRALLSTLSIHIGDELPGLFETTPHDVQRAAALLSGSRSFASYTRSFFNRLVSEALRSWLDRTLSAQVGLDRRFSGTAERAAFDMALAQYSSEATRIIREFAGGWYGKTLHREGRIDATQAATFGSVCFRKITEELRVTRGSDA
ncbi:hypothetical protein [Defluviimonas salinarum]|uniref:Uncharacterized protein n=1 Tax=Defluviimonas salinarum TaxID=2992147 RepID=A0ABT3JA54_9RHOB|nr:hypothetical protein [Defluviimonas salinarum]MCW3784573.1 hypothetical protein [Defluviimonas salinarum]